ncbi:deoxyhypusine synthase family protein [bacterium]|nr:deoxyhypusine synthase family protein [bacterium]
MDKDQAKDPERISIQTRSSKVHIGAFGRITSGPTTIVELLNNLPDILAARDLKQLVHDIIKARTDQKGIIMGLGGHVIKTGVAPYLIELMKQGFVSAIAMNGAAMIHDFEIVLMGHTSENVEQEIVKGHFGFTQETASTLNAFIVQAAAENLGLGEMMCRAFRTERFQNQDMSIIAQAGQHDIPLTIHVAIGTDVIHMHPECNGAALGQTSHYDFKRFCRYLGNLDGGGGYLNFGSAVIMPEVFLKALSLGRNQGCTFNDFFCANFDFIQHYRPTQSIINRPRLFGARTYSLTGHHEIMVPLLVSSVLELSQSQRKV